MTKLRSKSIRKRRISKRRSKRRISKRRSKRRISKRSKRRSKKRSKRKYLDGAVDEEFIKYVDNNKCDIDLLRKSIITNDVEKFEYVISKCPEIIYEKKENALIFAVEFRRINIVKFLLDKGIIDIDSQDNYGHTALMHAIIKNVNDKPRGSLFIQMRDGMYTIIRLLLEKGANEKIKDNYNKTYEDYGKELESRYKFEENIRKIKSEIF